MQEKRKIKVKFVDFWTTCLDRVLIYERLTKWFDVCLSDDPDYLIYSVYGEEHLKYDNCIKIFYTGENLVPDFNLCDYAVGFEWMTYQDRYFRSPIYFTPPRRAALYMCKEKHLHVDEFLKKKESFCSFVYSNANADPFREQLLDKLSEYKKVNSGGRTRNNIGIVIPNGVEGKLAFQKKHLFSIACENSTHSGYVTEKLIESFAAGTVPIYWGDPDVKKIFNPKAFICVSDFENLDKLVEYVKIVDENPELYKKILAEPAFLDDQHIEKHLAEFDKWLCHIFEQPIEEARRISVSMYGNAYVDRIKRRLLLEEELNRSRKKPFISRILHRIKRKLIG